MVQLSNIVHVYVINMSSFIRVVILDSYSFILS